MKRVILPLMFTMVAGCTATRTLEPPSTLGTESAGVPPPEVQAASVPKTADLVAQAQPVASQPQLAKTASISLNVTDAERSSQEAVTWVRQAGGELLNLADNGVVGEMRRLQMEFQVPASQLEDIVAKFTTLGTLASRQITAEDVSNQLVDLGARLRNLRKSEELLLKIMERSGSVGDVLKVTQELSQVREQIEQLDALRLNLQNRVQYSRIQLTLATPLPEAPGLGKRLSEAWNQATTSLGNFTAGLLQVGLWVLVFSPYILVSGLLLWLIRTRYFRPRPAPRPPEQSG